MDPFRFNRVEPRTFAGPRTDDDAHPACPLRDLPMMVAEPARHGVTAVPGGVVPDQPPRREAGRRELGGAPRQTIDRHRTDGAPRDTPPPPLVRLGPAWPHQQPITGQRLGIGIVRGAGQFLHLVRGLGICPAMVVGLGEPTPPDVVATAQRPRWRHHGQLDQVVAPFFFRR